MPRTQKTTKTKKTSKVSNARRRTTRTESVLARTQTPIEVVKDMATKSLRFGLGLGAYLLDSPQNIGNIKLDSLRKSLRGNLRDNLNSFVTTAIHKGQKIERQQLDWLTSFEREQRKRVKEFLAARRRDLQRTEASLEDRIEEVITSLDIPTRQDIHQLNRRLNELSKQLSHQKVATKSTKRTKATGTVAESTSA